MSNLRPSTRLVAVVILLAFTAIGTLGNLSENRTFFDSVRDFLGLATTEQTTAQAPPQSTTAPENAPMFAGVTATGLPSATYPTLAAAINALNGATITTPIVITADGTPETAPAGGFVITATGTATNTITITGAGTTVTAFSPQVTGSAASSFDAIFKIHGGDYITIQGFTLQENSGNTVVTPGTTNTMTEFGVLLVHASATDGASNNTIQNNTIALNSTYTNSVGIFSTSSSSTANASLDATSTAGTNSNNRIYGNTISNVAQGILLICPPVTATVFETGNEIGGAAGTANSIIFGNATASSGPWNRSQSTVQAGIYYRNGAGMNIRFNSVTSNSVAYVGSGGLNGIMVSSGTVPTGITYTTTISDNTVNITSTGVALLTGIDFGHGIATGTLVGSNNNVTVTQTSSAANSAVAIGIKANYASSTNTANSNTVVINQSSSSGALSGAATGVTLAGTAATTITANSINITLNVTGSGTGTITAAQTGLSVAGTSTVNTANSNTILFNQSTSIAAGITTGAITGILATTAATTSLNIGSTNQITVKQAVSGSGSYGTNTVTYLSVNAAHNNVNITNNTFNTTGSTVRSTGALDVILGGSSTLTGTLTITGNTANIDRVATSGAVGFYTQTSTTPNDPTDNISSNNITFTNLAGTSSATVINRLGGATGGVRAVSSNSISVTGTNTGTIVGINTGFGATGTFSGNAITINSASATLNGLLINGNQTTAIIANTVLSLSSSAAAPTAMTGVSVAGTGAHSITGTSVNAMNFTGIVTTSPTVIAISLSAGTLATVSGNTLANVSAGVATSSGSPAISGIAISGGSGVSVVKNKIYGLSAASSGISTTVNGIRITGGGSTNPNNIYNNVIGSFVTGAANAPDAQRGISITSTTTSTSHNVFYNTIYLSGSSTAANFGGAALFHAGSATSTTSTLNSRNNILVNLLTPAGSGAAAAFQRSGATGSIANFATTSNNNLYYGGTPSTTRLIYYDTNVNLQTLAAYKSGIAVTGAMGSRDSAAISENPNFLSTVGSNANFLHINPAISSQIESGAVNIAGIADDIDANVRQGNPGYPSQTNGGGTAPDIGADEFDGLTQDLAGPSISYTPFGNTTDITDRVLSSVITDASGVNGTAGTRPRLYYKKSTDANTYVGNTSADNGWKYVEASGSTSPFSFTTDYSKLTSPAAGNDIIQYFVVAQDNFPTPNVSINSGIFAATPTSVDLAAAQFPLTGTIREYRIAALVSGNFVIPGTFTSLTNNGGVFEYINNNIVNGNITIEVNADLTTETGLHALNGFNPVGTVKIYPTGGATPASPRLITGAAASTALIRLNGASFVTIDGSVGGVGTDRSMYVENTSTTSPSVIRVGSVGTNPAVDNTVKNLQIRNGVNTSSAVTVTDTAGSAAGYVNNFVFQNNSVERAFRGVFVNAIVTGSNGSGTVITENTMATSGANSIRLNPIFVAGTNEVTISNNTLGGISNANAEVPVGINVSTGSNNVTVSGNNITGITSTNTSASGSASGILINSAVLTNGLVTNNTIATLSSAGTSASFFGIGSFSPNLSITNNTISGMTQNAASSAWGIVVSGANSDTITGNTISGISGGSASGGVNGIQIQGSSTGAVLASNTVSTLTSSGTGTVSGINTAGTSSGTTIDRNTLHSISNTNSGGWGANGIWLGSTATTQSTKVKNNFIRDITGRGFDGGDLADNGYGIVVSGGSGLEVHYNSVSLTANQTNAGRPAAINVTSGVTANSAISLLNNIFANFQTTTGERYSIYSGAASSVFSPIDNNDYFTTGTNLGFIAGSNRSNLAAIVTNFGGNAGSISANPQFTSTTDLRIKRNSPSYGISPVENKGVPIVGITTDFEGDLRDVGITDIGADEVMSVNFSNATSLVAENAGVATIFVNRTSGSATASTVAYQTNDGSAVNGSCSGVGDYESTSGVLNFAAGETFKSFTVTICDDSLFENAETIDLTLSNVTGGSSLGAPAIHTLTITDNETAPTVSINDVEFPADSLVDTKFTVTLSAASGANTTVPYSSGGGTATGGTGCGAGQDYESVSGTLTFAPGITVQEIPISICPDTIQEPTETFNLTLGTPTGATILDGVGIGTISSSDSAAASVADGSLTEGNAGTSNMSFAVNLTTTSSSNTTINYTLTNGTATAGSDFDGTAGSITVNAGDTTGTILIPINGDITYEANETFTVTITSPDVAIGTGTATGTINNDDNPLATVVVNTTADTDDGFCLEIGEGNGCSLREAINAANANNDATTINFGIPGSAPFTISPTTQLPSIDFETIVAGESQTGYVSSPVIEISGLSAPDNAVGLFLNGDNATVRNLVVNNFSPGTGFGVGVGSNNTISGNYIGTDITGMVAAPNQVGVNTNYAVNTILSGNLISGHTNTAVGGGWTGGQILNNLIGTDQTGATALPNGDDGIFVFGNGLLIQGNTISGNISTGIVLASTATTVHGNFIGTDSSGSAIIGNGVGGISIQNSVSGHQIGGTGVGQPNIIANNGFFGIIAEGSPTPVGISVRANSIHSNSSLGFDLGNDGVTANDIGDGDIGPNNLQNFPVITSAEVTGSTKHIVGTLNSTPSTTFAIDVYGNVACDGTGYGEGQTYVGSFNVTTDVNGDASFDVTSLNPTVGSFLTATATDPSGNTSEFSACQVVVSGTGGTIQFSSPTYSVGEAGGTVSITVNRNGGTDGSVSATLSVSDGTAVAPGDYAPFTTTTVTFPDGNNTPQTFNITINDDSVYETDESIALELSSTTVNIGGETATVTITDNDTAPTISVGNVTTSEGNAGTTSFTFTLTKTGSTEVDATVSYATANGTASSATDFAAISTTPVTFLPAETDKSVTVLVNGDATFETNETFGLNLSTAVNAALGSNGTGTINNDDAVPTVSVNDVEFVGQSVTDTKFTVTLTGSSEVTATVNYDTNDITALRGTTCTGSADYQRATGTLTFLAGETSKTVTVTICPDSVVEPTETFSFDLSGASNATVSDAQGIGTISSDDSSAASIVGVTANEGNAGTSTFTFPVNLSNPVATPVTINYSTSDVTANAGSDFVGVISGSIVIPALSTSGNVLITVNGDQNFEPNETFTVTITSPDVSIGTGNATGTITNDETVPTLAFSSANYSGTEGASATVTVNRTGAVGDAVSVQYATSNGSAAAGVCGSGGDYVASSGTLNFAANEVEKTISITLCDDLVVETGETVNLALNSPGGGAVLGLSSAVLTINNAGSGTTAISGLITKFTGGGGLENVTVTLSNGSSTLTATTNASGAYSFSGLPDNQNYLLTPTCPSNPTCLGYVFDPSSREYLNLSGSVTNANFVGYLNDNPRDISVVNTQQTTFASNVTVPITVASRGTENSFDFTLNFDPALLQFSSVSCGASPPVGCTAFGTPGVGSVAISVDLAAGVTFATGLRQVALVTFTTTPGTAFNTPITFASSPRSVKNVSDIEIPADYVNGNVIFAQGLEGDVAGCPSSPNCIGVPANSGYPNGTVNAGDLTRLRNLVAGLATANSLINEFQRADIAPFIGRGDGRLTSGDVTVMRRYITGDLASVRLPASGPISATSFVDLPLDPTGQRDETERETPFRVIGGSASHGENVTIAVELDQRGVENSYSYSLQFDPTRLALANGGVRLDSMTMLGGGALTVNYTDAANGNIGILFDMPAGQVITNGATRHTVLLTFYVPKRAPFGDASILFADTVAERYLSNAIGDPLRFKFVPGVVQIVPTAR